MTFGFVTILLFIHSFIHSSTGIMDHLTTSSHRKDQKGKIVNVIELSVMNGRIGTDSLTCSLHKSQVKKMCDCKLVLSFFGVMDEPK
jgi:hypothetical protein